MVVIHMFQAAFQNQQHGVAAEIFSAASIPAVDVGAFTPLTADRPGPHFDQAAKTNGAQAQVDTAIRSAHAQQDNAIRRHGLAEHQTRQLAPMLGPFELIFPGSMYSLAAEMFFYAASDRRSSNENKHKQKPKPLYAFPSEERHRTNWNRTGYHAANAPKDEGSVSKAQMEAILRPLGENHRMRTLLAQQASTLTAQTHLGIRERGGLPRNRQTLDAALEQGQLGWVFKPDQPAPHFL